MLTNKFNTAMNNQEIRERIIEVARATCGLYAHDYTPGVYYNFTLDCEKCKPVLIATIKSYTGENPYIVPSQFGDGVEIEIHIPPCHEPRI